MKEWAVDVHEWAKQIDALKAQLAVVIARKPKTERWVGYGAAVANCPTSSVDAFASCLATSLRKASSAFLGSIEPAACALAWVAADARPVT